MHGFDNHRLSAGGPNSGDAVDGTPGDRDRLRAVGRRDAPVRPRRALQAGEIWRLATCHLTHWNAEHLQWDLLMFVVLGAVCELRNPRRMWLCTRFGGGVRFDAGVLFVSEHRSVSRAVGNRYGVVHAAGHRSLGRCASASGEELLAAVAIGGLLFGFIAKTAYEAVTGPLFLSINIRPALSCWFGTTSPPRSLERSLRLEPADQKSNQDISQRKPVFAASY